MATIKVLHVSTTIDRGGAENHLADLIEGQVRQGLTVACAYLKHQPYWRPRLEALGVKIAALKLKHVGEPGPAVRLWRLIRAFQPDVIHAHGTQAEIYAYIATRLMRVPPPLVISRHEERTRFFRVPGFAAINRLLTAAGARFIAISHSLKALDVKRTPAIADKMDVVHYGYEPSRRATGQRQQDANELRSEWGVGIRSVLIVTVARLVEDKSLDTLIKAFARCLQQKPQRPISLVIVGRGPLESELHALADRLGLRGKVHWAGFREDIPTVLDACDIFVLPSVREGFGLVLLEAMAAGRPVIASEVSAIPEIVSNGRTGLLFPPRNSDALAERLDILCEDESLRKALGRAGRARLQQDFPVHKMVERTTEVYKELLAAGGLT